MKKTLTFLLILSSIIGFSQTKPTDPGFKSLITPRAVTFWWDAANSDPWMQSSYLGTAPNTWVKLWTATKIQVKLDSLANAKQDTLTLTTTGTGAATLIGSTLNIPISSGILPDSLKEDKVNKENATVSNDTIKYPTVNLLKTYAAPLTLFDKLQNYLIYWNGTKFAYSSFRETESIDYRGSLWAGYLGSPYYGTSQYLTVDIGSSQGAVRISGANTPILGGTGSTPNLVISRSVTSQAYGEKPNLLNYVESFILDGNTGAITLPDLASTNPELLSHSSDGTITSIANGSNGQVLKIIDNAPVFTDDLNINTPQELSGTSVSLDYSLGRNMNITLTGSTTITMSNLVAGGLAGEIHVINAASVAYPITFAGYLFEFSQAVWKSGNTVVTSGLGKPDHFTYYYNGTTVEILGQVGLKVGLRP